MYSANCGPLGAKPLLQLSWFIFLLMKMNRNWEQQYYVTWLIFLFCNWFVILYIIMIYWYWMTVELSSYRFHIITSCLIISYTGTYVNFVIQRQPKIEQTQFFAFYKNIILFCHCKSVSRILRLMHFCLSEICIQHVWTKLLFQWSSSRSLIWHGGLSDFLKLLYFLCCRFFLPSLSINHLFKGVGGPTVLTKCSFACWLPTKFVKSEFFAVLPTNFGQKNASL